MRVAFVTTADAASVHDDVDISIQREAFARAGHELLEWPWEDRSLDWSAPDLIVIRSPWNWTSDVVGFGAWLDRVESPRLHNPAPVVRWNLDKRYLADLAEAGVSVVPTHYVRDPADVTPTLASFASGEVVVKPTVSAGSRLTGRFAADAVAAEALARAILAEGNEVMIQPHLEAVARDGEVGVVCIDGVISHAFVKGPILAPGGGFVSGAYEERITPHALSNDEREVVDAALGAVDAILRVRALSDGSPLLYCRIDLVRLDDGGVAVLELEAFEPCLFLPVDPDAGDRFVRAVEARL